MSAGVVPTAVPAAAETDGPRLLSLKIVALVVIVVGVAADLVSKAYFADLLHMDAAGAPPFGRIELIRGFFALEGTYNPGVTFGLAHGQTVPILIFTILATVGLGIWVFATRRRSTLLHVALGMVLGGALGNLWDRLHWAKVRDFFLIYTGDPANASFEWPNFNVADSLIVCGVILILMQELFGRRSVPSSDEAGTT